MRGSSTDLGPGAGAGVPADPAMSSSSRCISRSPLSRRIPFRIAQAQYGRAAAPVSRSRGLTRAVQGRPIGIKPCNESGIDRAQVRFTVMRWPEIFRCASRFGVVLAGWAGVVMATAGEPRLNQLQVIGTHNSYHIAPASAVLELIGSTG